MLYLNVNHTSMYSPCHGIAPCAIFWDFFSINEYDNSTLNNRQTDHYIEWVLGNSCHVLYAKYHLSSLFVLTDGFILAL